MLRNEKFCALLGFGSLLRSQTSFWECGFFTHDSWGLRLRLDQHDPYGGCITMSMRHMSRPCKPHRERPHSNSSLQISAITSFHMLHHVLQEMLAITSFKIKLHVLGLTSAHSSRPAFKKDTKLKCSQLIEATIMRAACHVQCG